MGDGQRHQSSRTGGRQPARRRRYVAESPSSNRTIRAPRSCAIEPIEGTQASVGDLVAFEAGNAPAGSSDVQEVANYVTALDYGLTRLGELPLVCASFARSTND